MAVVMVTATVPSQTTAAEEVGVVPNLGVAWAAAVQTAVPRGAVGAAGTKVTRGLPGS